MDFIPLANKEPKINGFYATKSLVDTNLTYGITDILSAIHLMTLRQNNKNHVYKFCCLIHLHVTKFVAWNQDFGGSTLQKNSLC
jgi:hypothetical protein